MSLDYSEILSYSPLDYLLCVKSYNNINTWYLFRLIRTVLVFETELSWRRDVELQMNPWNLELAMKSRVSVNRIVWPEELQSGQNHLNFSSQSSDISLIKIAHNCQQKLLFAPSAIGSEQTVEICPVGKKCSQWRNDCY